MSQSVYSSGGLTVKPSPKNPSSEYTSYTPYSPALSDTFPGTPRSTAGGFVPGIIEEEPELDHGRKERGSNPFSSAYLSISWMLGFRERYSLLWFFVFGGALLGYCLARSMMLNPGLIIGQTVPGEFFFFGRKLFKINYYIHIYLSIIGGILVGAQFLPGMRIGAVSLHRVNGYVSLICLIPGNICGSIIAAKSFGGEINVQVVYYLLGVMIVVSGLLGYYFVKKDTRQHRKWMLRMVVYFSVIITARVIMLITRAIIAKMGTFYSVWRCDQVLYLATDLESVQSLYPTCFGSGVDTSKVFVAVLGGATGSPLNQASGVRVSMGMALWVSTILHIIGVEYYIYKTEDLNATRYGYILEREDHTNEKTAWEYKRR